MAYKIEGIFLLGATGKEMIRSLEDGLRLYLGEGKWEEMLCFKNSNFLILSFEDHNIRSREWDMWISGDRSKAIFLWGRIFNMEWLTSNAGFSPSLEGMYRLYQRDGIDFLKDINGSFSLALWDGQRGSFFIARDKVGTLPLYYFIDGRGIVFGSRLRPISSVLRKSDQLDPLTLAKYLSFCYNPGRSTIIKGIERLMPANYLLYDHERVSLGRYWSVSFKGVREENEEVIGERIRDLLSNAVKIRISSSADIGVFLSGGLDSSTIVSLLHSHGVDGLKTFSFRCRGESFDESGYASVVSSAFNTDHRLIEYLPEDILLAEEMVSFMDEPFCDVGINIASYLLARSARGEVGNIFTGDGGDELFAGHPVYIADKTAKILKPIPGFILSPLFLMGRMVHDSEKKKDWKVKLKRFSESYRFPPELGTHRWRIYYSHDELARILNPEFYDKIDPDLIYEDIIRFNTEADGFDSLSRSLYSDYQTVVQFYLMRMNLVRSLGMAVRFPMLDVDLVEYCATIPSNLKIRGFSDTKYIERVAVRPILPGQIVDRRDKLGHSIPMKNWIRHNKKVREFFFSILSEEVVRKRGIFNFSYIERLLRNHIKRKENNSHRLWALLILELWMRSLTGR